MTSTPNDYRSPMNNLRREGMTESPNGPNMTSLPRDYRYQEDLAKKEQIKENFFKRFFFGWDMRMLEAELQRLKISKSDLIESSFQKSELGFFNLFFNMIPVISISLLALFLSLLLYIVVAQFSVVVAIIITILFLSSTVFQNAKIVYRLNRHKIGERATGRFIKTVRSVWHVFEIIYIMCTVAVGILYVMPINWDKFEKSLVAIHYKSPVFEWLWRKMLTIFDIGKLSHSFNNIVSGLLITCLLAMFLYIISSFMVYMRSNKEQKESQFKVKREVENPAELAREKLDF